ncbi:TPA: hypothetical protein HA338_10750 [Methanosarcina acetivorans]|uniref:Uncharacterized protein n=1 Tax=Methanosarcina acetivorans TaxID=2214 RepID=A0A832WAQ9_9EURY|nr:hypothetical protein [Methanosarcina acetivorans]HIH94475.1 hypothetical protein [Methanosarcina acetivorans]
MLQNLQDHGARESPGLGLQGNCCSSLMEGLPLDPDLQDHGARKVRALACSCKEEFLPGKGCLGRKSWSWKKVLVLACSCKEEFLPGKGCPG